MKKISLIMVMVLLLAGVGDAVTVGVMPLPKMRFWNTTGTAALANGKLVTCASGATCGCTSYTGKTTYTDSTGTTPNTNPVVLDSRGEASVWLTSGETYKFALCSSTNVLQWTQDGIIGVTDTTVTLSEWVPSGLTPTYISGTSFSVPGDKTSTFVQGERVQSTNTAGTIYSTVVSSSYGSSVTTVTVISDSGTLDSGLSAVNTSLLRVGNLSRPIQPVVTKTSGYTITPAECGKTLLANITSAATFTLPAASAVPSGCEVVTRNTGSVLTLAGTVGTVSNPTITTGASFKAVSDGSGWYGDETYAGLFTGYTSTVMSAGTYTVNVLAGELLLVTMSETVSCGSGTTNVNLAIASSGTATVVTTTVATINNVVASSASARVEVGSMGSIMAMGVVTVTASGSLGLTPTTLGSGGTCIPSASNKFLQLWWLRKRGYN